MASVSTCSKSGVFTFSNTFWQQAQGLLSVPDGGVGTGRQQAGHGVSQIGVLGQSRQPRFQPRPGLLPSPGPHQGHGAHEVGEGIAGIQLDDPDVVGDRLVDAPPAHQQVGQLEVGFGEVGIRIDGLPAVFQGLFLTTHLDQSHGEVQMDPGLGGGVRQSGLELPDGLLHPAHLRQGRSQVH